MKKTKSINALLPLIAAVSLFLAGCESPMNPAGDPPDPGPGPAPALPLTADLSYVSTECQLAFDTEKSQGTGSAAETWHLGGGKSPAAYFGAEKTTAQTITLGGKDGGRAAKAAVGASVDGLTADPELDLFTVDTSGMLLGGTLEFTLTVSEAGRRSKTVTVFLTVEASAGAGLYKGDARIEAADGETGDNILVKALAWLKKNAEEGAAYTVILENDITLAPTVLSQANLNNTLSVSITLLGKGGERSITLASNGTLFQVEQKHILRVGNNITLRGFEGATSGYLVDIKGTCDMSWEIYYKAVFELLDGGKLTDYKAKTSESNYVVRAQYGTFAMKGGTITGNDTYSIVKVSGSGGVFAMTGGTITGNTVVRNVVDLSRSADPGILQLGELSRISGGEIRWNTFDPDIYMEGDLYLRGNNIALFLSGNPQIGKIVLVNNGTGESSRSWINIGAGGFTGTVETVDLNLGSSGSYPFEEKISRYWTSGNQIPVLQRGAGYTGLLPVSRFPLNQFKDQRAGYETKPINPGRYYIDPDTGCLVAVPAVDSFTVNPAAGTVYKGGVQYFNTTVSGENSPSQEISWEITGPHTAGTVFDGAAGKLTIDAGETASVITLRATPVEDSGFAKTITLNVASGPAPARQAGFWIGDSGIPVDFSDEAGANPLLQMHGYLQRHMRSDTVYTLLLDQDIGLIPVANNKGLCLMPYISSETAGINTNGSTGVTIVLRGLGGERTLSLTASAYFAKIGSGITLILDENITVQGRAANGANSLFWVENGGALEVRAGSKITGNETTTGVGNGAGIRVNNGGTLRIKGGTITGNSIASATLNGGGVYVAGGAAGGVFEMTGGSITGNSAGTTAGANETTGALGGGVFINYQNVRAVISGGTISGNNGLGDLYVASSSSYTSTVTLSGSPSIGALVLHAYNAAFRSSAIIGMGGFNPAAPVDLHLHLTNPGASIETAQTDLWIGKAVLVKGEGFGASLPVGKFDLGNFYNTRVNASGGRVSLGINLMHIDSSTGNLVND